MTVLNFSLLSSFLVFHKTGQPHSVHLAEQRTAGCGPLGGPLRFDNTVAIWVQCEQEVLEERCNRRVDKMIDRGMIKELEQFHQVRCESSYR